MVVNVANYNWEQFEDEEPKKSNEGPKKNYDWSQFEGDEYESTIEPISPKIKALKEIKQKYPKAPDWLIHGLMSAVGEGSHPGLEKAANIAEPIGKAAKTATLSLIPGKLLGKAALPIGKLAWNSLKDIPKDISNIKKYAEQPKLAKKVATAEEEAQTAKEAYENAQENALENYDVSTSGSLKNKSNTNLNKADLLREKYGDMQPIKIPHNRPQYEGQHLTESPQQEQLKALTGLTEAEEAVPEAEEAHNKALDVLEEAGMAHQEHLGAGRTHNVHLGKGIKEIQENVIKPQIQSKYKTIEENSANKGAVVSRSPENEQLLQDIRLSYEKAPGLSAAEKEAAAQKTYNLNKGPETESTIPAKDVIANYRSYRDFINNQFRRSRSYGLDAKERQAIDDSLPEMRKNLEKLDEVLKDTLGDEDYKLFKQANKEWKEKITPTYGNPVWTEIYKHGRTSDNFIKSVAGEEPGNMLLKDIVKNSPAFLRFAVGQRVATKPESLHGYNEALEEYTNLMPELNKITETHKAATKGLSDAQKVLSQTKRSHSQAINRMNKAERQLKQAESEQKSLQSKARSSEKEENSLTKKEMERKSALEEMPKLEKLAKEQEAEAIRLRNAKKDKNISLIKKMKLEKEYKANEAAFNKTKVRIGVVAALIGIKKYLS